MMRSKGREAGVRRARRDTEGRSLGSESREASPIQGGVARRLSFCGITRKTRTLRYESPQEIAKRVTKGSESAPFRGGVKERKVIKRPSLRRIRP